MDKAQLKVLALDDEPFMLKLLGHLLLELGYTGVIACENGRDALRYVDSPATRPDLILLDLNMPDMDGVEFVRELVAHHYNGSLILVSGEDDRVLQMVVRLIEAHGISILGHLHKPFKVDALSRLMAKSLSSPGPSHSEPRPYTAEQVRIAIFGHELVNYYQPKVCIANGAVVGVEALVRWLHPQDGMVYPDQFIGISEECGLIDGLTRVVARNAMRHARDWRKAGIPLRIAINVSMENLTSVGFAKFMADESAASGIPPQDIVLEVTESRLILDQRAPLEILTRLRMNGYRISIDDFGTGHSSLKLLRDIPFDELKIDRNFVQDARRDPTARAIYDASLALGKQLGMQVVAEGVEDKEDWDLVRETGCDMAQGYFIARPMPAEEFPGWLDAWRTAQAQRQAGGSPA